jgi:hypothetical protein
MAVPYLLSFGWVQRYKIKNTSHKKWYDEEKSVLALLIRCFLASINHITAHLPSLLQPIPLLVRMNSVMRKIAFLLVPFLGVALAKSEKMMEQKSEMVQLVKLDPRKNYRVKMAKQYFGGGGGRCHKWNRFCGR